MKRKIKRDTRKRLSQPPLWKPYSTITECPTPKGTLDMKIIDGEVYEYMGTFKGNWAKSKMKDAFEKIKTLEIKTKRIAKEKGGEKFNVYVRDIPKKSSKKSR